MAWSRSVALPALLGAALLGLVACGSPPPSFPESERERFETAWAELLSYLDSHHPDIDLKLRRPATEEAISAFEASVGHALPGPVRELYLRADGQEPDAFALFPHYGFHSLEEASGQWRLMRSWKLRLLSWAPAEGDPGVRDRWWHPRWIPIGSNGSGDLLVVDRSPAVSGLDGQIVEFVHDDTGRTRIAPGMTELLESLRADVESGLLVPHPEWKTFVRPEDAPR